MTAGRKKLVVPSSRDAAIVECRLKGQSLRVIGAQYGVTYERVRQIVTRWAPGLPGPQRHVIPRQGGYTHPKPIFSRCRELWKQGLAVSAIAERVTLEGYPITKDAVIGMAHRNHFPPRPSPIKRFSTERDDQDVALTG